MARRSTRLSKPTEKYSPEPIVDRRPFHRKGKQPKGVLRLTDDKTDKKKKRKIKASEPTQVEPANPLAAIRLMPKEFDAVVGLRRMQLGMDGFEARQRELAHLEVGDPIGHYYAQTTEERAPYQLQAASVLFEMSGGEISGPLAALTMMKMKREEEEMGRRKAGAMLLAGWRVSNPKQHLQVVDSD